MSAKQVLEGINLLRDVVNHPNLSDAEKIAALKVSVEEVRNDIQDLTSEIFATYAPQVQDEATAEEEDAVYESLKSQGVNDLIFFYKRSVFAQIKTTTARLSLARILLRIAQENHADAPALWVSIAASAGELNED